MHENKIYPTFNINTYQYQYFSKDSLKGSCVYLSITLPTSPSPLLQGTLFFQADHFSVAT